MIEDNLIKCLLKTGVREPFVVREFPNIVPLLPMNDRMMNKNSIGWSKS